ncbi:PKD domain-containing protein [Halegenticoccus soli]|uniref:PKD domain-containing protein n=1 Tax=Halegenticoccus soli TaxID=1985678 RepID=UPI0013043EE0|nr:PKD domain-containing protein [Halegenticoccus soli]
MSGNATAEETDVSRSTFKLREGTEEETTVYETVADEDGPTVVVVGGMHGDEEAGYRAANYVREWAIGAGTLVTIPRANARAVERGTRNGPDGVDLNRQFEVGERPGTELAREIWNLVRRYDPDMLIDLHESRGIYRDDQDPGLGQAVFHSQQQKAYDEAEEAVRYVNRNHVSNPRYLFKKSLATGPDMPPYGLLIYKASYDLGATSHLVETYEEAGGVDKRVGWQLQIVRQLINDLLSGDSDEEVDDEPGGDEPEDDTGGDDSDGDAGEGDGSDGDGGDDGSGGEPNQGPTARIETNPANADELDLSSDDVVTLDGSASSDADGEIASYDWNVEGLGKIANGGGSGDTVDVTFTGCGEMLVTLTVTDADGATDTAQVTLSTLPPIRE